MTMGTVDDQVTGGNPVAAVADQATRGICNNV